jgi:hypothetical protein
MMSSREREGGREEPDKFALSPVVSTSTTLLGHAHYTSYTPNTYTTPRNKSKGLNYLYTVRKTFRLRQVGWMFLRMPSSVERLKPYIYGAYNDSTAPA